MPLKLFRRGDVWYVRGTVAGTPLYETTGTADPERAEAFRAKREAQLWDSRVFGKRATVTFPEAVASYIRYAKPGSNDERKIDRLLAHFGTDPLGKIDQSAVDRAIERLMPGAAPSSVIRSIITPLTAIMNHAAKRNWCDPPKFQRPKVPREETRWLTPAEALALIDAASDHLKPLLGFLLCTGARLSEALDLQWHDVHLSERFVMLRDTKSGRDRKAALTEGAMLALANLPLPDGDEEDGQKSERKGHVFLTDAGEPYTDRMRVEGGQIKTAFRGAARRAGLIKWEPAGPGDRTVTPVRWRPTLTPHDLRHTWATWFYALSKDLLLLKSEGDWSSIKMVERYAHLMRAEHTEGIEAVWGGPHPRIAGPAWQSGKSAINLHRSV